MPQLRVLLGFTSAPDSTLLERAQAVHDHLYSSSPWTVPPETAPPITQAALGTAIDTLRSAMAAADQGGPADTAAKNTKRETLISHLRQLAGHVQARHGNDLAKLLASGFEAVSNNRASSELEAPTIRDILNGNSGQLIVRVGVVPNAKAYEVRYALLADNGTPGAWQDGGLFTNSRNMAINHLTPGSNYQFQARAIGGSTGYSDWSDPVSHRSL